MKNQVVSRLNRKCIKKIKKKIPQHYCCGIFFINFLTKKTAMFHQNTIAPNPKYQILNKNNMKIEKTRSHFGNNLDLFCDVGHRMGFLYMV